MAGTLARAYSVRHKGIAEYCDSQLLGMTAAYRVLETRRLAKDLLLEYMARGLLVHRATRVRSYGRSHLASPGRTMTRDRTSCGARGRARRWLATGLR